MYSLAHRILKNLNPETAHNLSIQGLKLGLYPKINFKNTNILEQTIWGRRFQTPIGLSAGFDKKRNRAACCSSGFEEKLSILKGF